MRERLTLGGGEGKKKEEWREDEDGDEIQLSRGEIQEL